MSKISKKHYLRIEFENSSPLSVGSGENDATDKDIVKDSLGRPYIPGSALAGIYRSFFSASIQRNGKKARPVNLKTEADIFFGPEIIGSQGEANLTMNSQVLVYDAQIVEDSWESRIVTRDMVGLGPDKVAKKGAKFDMEALEQGQRFVTYLEWNEPDKQGDARCDTRNPLDIIADAWLKNQIRVGGKTGRGYGSLKSISIQGVSFDFAGQAASDCYSTDQWLDFDMYADELWKDYQPTEHLTNGNTVIRLNLAQVGGIAVRKYSTSVGQADYEQLVVKQKSVKKNETEEIPVIPGTSWAGAFRAQMCRLSPEFKEKKEIFFGSVKPETKKSGNSAKEGQKTRIVFSETMLEGANPLVTTRNAIDRFTNATVDGALYTEKTWFGGHTTLEIVVEEEKLRKSKDADLQMFYRVLAAAIADLHEGFLSVGGLTAVGRGLFTVNGISIQLAGQEKAVEITERTLKQGGEALYSWLSEVLNQRGEKI